MPTKPPTVLYRVHRVLISTGIFCAAMMSFYGVTMYRRRGEAASLGLALAGGAAMVGLLAYLRYFNRKIAQ